MTCAPFDLRDYLFGELNAAETDSVEHHVRACAACRDEVAALDATRSAVMLLREEEPVRRIAFVSDKVFEPRWWQRLFASGPQLGFASAAMLAAAIVFHAVQAPAVVPGAASAPPAAVVAQVDQKAIEAEIAKRVAVAVEKASVEIEARQADKLQVVSARLADTERRYQLQMSYAAQYVERLQQRNANYRRAAFDAGGTELQ